MHIAVVGTGISGNAAAWALSGQHQVTVYEQDRRPGGHSHTVEIDYDGTGSRSTPASSSITSTIIPN
jgi:predicted NAD/FAD-binding protein